MFWKTKEGNAIRWETDKGGIVWRIECLERQVKSLMCPHPEEKCTFETYHNAEYLDPRTGEYVPYAGIKKCRNCDEILEFFTTERELNLAQAENHLARAEDHKRRAKELRREK